MLKPELVEEGPQFRSRWFIHSTPTSARTEQVSEVSFGRFGWFLTPPAKHPENAISHVTIQHNNVHELHPQPYDQPVALSPSYIESQSSSSIFLCPIVFSDEYIFYGSGSANTQTICILGSIIQARLNNMSYAVNRRSMVCCALWKRGWSIFL